MKPPVTSHAVALVLISLLAAGCSDSSENNRVAPEFKERPCAFPDGTPGLERITCGMVTVAVRPGDAAGRTVDIGLAIVGAANPEAKKDDPILFIQGGPASPAVMMAPQWVGSVMAEDRDIIIFDRRGSHFSGPRLCPDTSFALVSDVESDLTAEESLDWYVEKARTCRQEMTENGHAPQDYTITRITEDIESIRRALGVSQWNVIGHSAGGPQALDLMRSYPKSTRAVILESAAHLRGDDYGAVYQRLFARSLRKIFDDCAAEPACAAQHPDPEKTLMEALASFEEAPLELMLPGADGAPGQSVFLNHQDLVVLLFSQTYNAADVPNIPNMIAAAAQRNVQVFAPLAGMFSFLEAMSAEDVRLSIECDHFLTRETIPAPAPANALQEAISRASPAGLQYSEVCPVFLPDVAESALDPELPSVDVPVLVMTGEYDGIIPPAVGKAMADGLKRAYHVNFDYASHQLFVPHACTHAVAKSFFDAPLAPPDASSCQAAITSPFRQ